MVLYLLKSKKINFSFKIILFSFLLTKLVEYLGYLELKRKGMQNYHCIMILPQSSLHGKSHISFHTFVNTKCIIKHEASKFLKRSLKWQ